MKLKPNTTWFRFIISMGVLTATALIATGLFFIQIPSDNLQLVNTILGVFITMNGGILNFYFTRPRQNDKEQNYEQP